MNLKKILALVLVLAMLVSMVPTYAFAEDVELWDEEEVAVQDDAALEDVYLDEEPEEVIVEDEPEATEPEAVEVEEPAAEEPAAAEEPVAAAEAAPVEETVLSVAETNDFNAVYVAMVKSTGLPYDSFDKAFAATGDDDVITMLATNSDIGSVMVEKNLTIQAQDDTATLNGSITLTNGKLTLKNLEITNGITVTGGTLSIPAKDAGKYHEVKASGSVKSGEVAGGNFDKLPYALLADGYSFNATGTGGVFIPGRGTTTEGSGDVVEVSTMGFKAMIEIDDDTTAYFKSFDTAAAKLYHHEIVYGSETISIPETAAIEPLTEVNFVPKNGYTWVNHELRIVNVLPDIKISVTYPNKTGEHYVMTDDKAEGKDVITYKLVEATASYGDDKLTTKFADAAKEAVKLQNPKVTLFQIPGEGDTYELESGTLTVVATPTSLTNWNEDTARALVSPAAAAAGKAFTFSFAKNKTATYKIAEGKASINVDGEDVLFPSFSDAVLAAYYGEINGKTYDKSTLVVKPLENVTWSPRNATTWAGHPLKVATVLGITVDITYQNKTGEAYAVSKTPGDGYITYEVVPAVASYGEGADATYEATFKAAAQGAADAAADPQATTPPSYEVNLYKLPTDTTDVYEMGVGTMKVVATGTDVKGKLTEAVAKTLVTASGKALTVTVAEDKNSANYTVKDSNARIELADETLYFDSLQAAAKAYAAGTYDGKTIPADSVITVSKTQELAIPSGSYDAFKDVVLKIKAEEDATVSVSYVNAGSEHYAVSEKDTVGYTEYKLVEATASYMKTVSGSGSSVGQIVVYKEFFNDAATEAIKEQAPVVTLYKLPAADDTYAMAANGTLTVKATPTDLEGKWTEAAAKAIVTPDGEIVIKAEFTAATGTAVYTTAAAVAKAKLHQAQPTDPEFEYYATLEEAFDTVFIKRNNDNLYLIPLSTDEQVFEVPADDLATYTNVKVRIDNSDPTKVIKLKEFKDTSVTPAVTYAWSKTDGDNYSIYTLNQAVASIPMNEELDKYFEPYSGENVKYFSTFREAVAAGDGAVVSLYAPYKIKGTDKTYTETFELGALGGVATVSVKLNGQKWLTIAPYGEQALTTSTAKDPDDNNNVITTYSVGTAVASITTGTGASAKTTYYPTFEAAAKVGAKDPAKTDLDKIPVIKLMADIEDTYKLDTTKVMKVEKAGKNLDVVAKNADGTARPYTVVDETDEDGITTYTPKLAVASIGTGDDIVYYTSFDKAATAAAADDAENPETITLYAGQEASYELGKTGNVSVLKVIKNGTLSVTSGVAKQAVSKSTADNVTTYTLNADAAAYIYDTKDKSEVYYVSLEGTDGAKAAAEYDIKATSTKQLVLLKEVKTYIVGYGMQVNIKQGDIVPGEVKVADGCVKVETPSEDGTVINYKAEKAVASVASVTPVADEKPTYYATFAEAAKEAFVAEGTEPTKVVTLILKPAAKDQFEVESVGSVLIDVKGTASEEVETIANIQKNNFKLADGLFSANDKPASGKPYTVTITSAVAKVIKNNGEPAFYNSIANAAKVSKDAKHPIVLLANDLSYALAAGTTIYVVKGENEFTVTKVNPADPTIKVAIEVEELADGVTKYTAVDGEDIVAYINFQKTVDKGDFDTQTVNEYVYYTNFADAVEDANNGEYVIVLERAMKKTTKAPIVDETYVIESADEVVRVQEAGKITALIAPADGFALNKEAEKNAAGTATGVNKYTVFNSVAKVNAKHDGASTASDKNYPDLKSAIDDALKLGGTLTLLATPPLGFTYELVNNEYREDKLVLGASQYKFSRNHFTVAEGQYVDGKFDGTAETLTVKTAKFSIGEGDDLKYFDTFEKAVAAAQALEDQKGNNDKTKDKANPTAVISLYIDMDETAPYEIGWDVHSILVKDNGHKVSFKPASATGYFIEKTGSNMEGVYLYAENVSVASITTGTGNNEKTVDYSTFKAAAEAAFNTENVIKLHKMGTELAATDTFEMPVGELRLVYDGSDADHYSSSDLKNTVIFAKGERVFLDDEYVNGYRRFTVTGAVASITKQSGTTFYYDIADAIKAALGNDYVAITPLTDIDVRLDNDDLTKIGAADGKYFNVEDSEYSFSVKTDAVKVGTTAPVNYELVKDGNKYTFKEAVAYVVSEDEKSVDPDTNEPTYYNEYFATIEDASKYASNANAATPKTIVLLKNNSYVIKSSNEVVIAQLGDATHTNVSAFNVTTDIPGSAVKSEMIVKTAPYVYSFKVLEEKTITFKVNGGKFANGTTVDQTITAMVGEDITMFSNPSRTGYAFNYWLGDDGVFYGKTADAEKSIVALTKMPEKDLILEANWTANEYWVVYKFNAPEGTAMSDLWVRATYDELIARTPDRTTDHYKFGEWYTNSAKTNKFDFAETKLTDAVFNPTTPATGDPDKGTNAGSTFILYGGWDPKTYTIKFNTLCDTKVEDQVLDYGTAVTFPNAAGWTRPGYTEVTGWQYYDEATQKYVDWPSSQGASFDTTLVAVWTPDKVDVYFADGTERIGQQLQADVNSDITAPDVSTRTKDGYRLNTDDLWTPSFTGKVPYDESHTFVYNLNWIEQIPVSFFVDDEVTTINVDKNSSLAENKNVPAPTKEGYTLVWTLKGEQYDMTAAVSEKMTLVGEWVEGEDYSDYATISPSLSLEENINMNAYVKIKEGTDPADYDVLVTFDGETTKEGTLADLATYSRGEYKMTDIAVVAAPQMNVPAVVTIAYKGVEIISNAELTVRGYAEDWIEKSTDDSLVNLLTALLDFGAYSQLQFKYDTDKLANTKYTTGLVPSTVVPEFPMKPEGSVTGITGAKAALTLVSDTTLNVYFAAAKKNSGYQFLVDGEETNATYSKKEYKVALENIAVAELGTEHTFTVNYGNGTMSVTLAPMAYAFQHQGNDDLGNVCKAVYQYYLAAVEYFG